MPRNKKHGDNLSTGDGFITLAKSRGAKVTEGHDSFTKISTGRGMVKIAPGDDKLDTGTIHNLKRWFKLLGLLCIALVCIVFPFLRLILA